jgi:Zinc finger, C2H2 type
MRLIGNSNYTGILPFCGIFFLFSDPLLSEYNQGSPANGLDSPSMDLTSQSSSYLEIPDDLHENYKEDSDLQLELHLQQHPDDDSDLNLSIFRSKKARLDSLLIEKMGGMAGTPDGDAQARKKKEKPAKETLSSSKVAVKKNFHITADASKKWIQVETDQETLFGTTFKKKVWIRQDWPEGKKQERLRGFVWTEDIFQQAARGDFAMIEQPRTRNMVEESSGQTVKKKKKKKKKSTPDPPEIQQAMFDLQAYGKTLDDGSAVCTYPGCNKQFANISSFRKHRKSHAPKCHTCEVCGRSFTENSKLRRHYVVHTGEKPFQVGGKKF